jgi:hypothetical protein
MPASIPALVAHVIARRVRHRSVARRYAAEVERHARQVTLEVGRDQGPAAGALLYQMLDNIHRLQGELAAIRVIDEITPEARRSGAAA